MVSKYDRMKQISDGKQRARSDDPENNQNRNSQVQEGQSIETKQIQREPHRLVRGEQEESPIGAKRDVDAPPNGVSRMVWQNNTPSFHERDDQKSSGGQGRSMLYATLFAAENSTGVPQSNNLLPTNMQHSGSQDHHQEKFFTENRVRNRKDGKPSAQGVSLNESQAQQAAPNGRDTLRGRDDGNYYITAINTKRNPDLIIPGGAIKGNMYFRKHIDPDKEEPQTTDSQIVEHQTVQETGEEDDLMEDDMFSRLKNQQARYYTESNPTIKCRNCKEFGHMARECPNERSRPNCILCGKDTHDSFECDAKLCFKCNQRGHKANECTKTNVMKCAACGQIGHQQTRCLKVWVSTASSEQQSSTRVAPQRQIVTRHQEAVAKYKKCIECGNSGHFKCSSERQSKLIKLTFKVEDNLDEFYVASQNVDNRSNVINYEVPQRRREIKRNRKQKPEKQARRLPDLNVMGGDIASESYSSGDGSGGVSYSSEEDQSGSESYSSSEGGQQSHNRQKRSHSGKHQSQMQQKSRSSKSTKIQCCHCAEYHETNECTNKRAQGRYQQYENVRNRFAKDVGFSYRRGHETYVNDHPQGSQHHQSSSHHHHGQQQNIYQGESRSNVSHYQPYRSDHHHQSSHSHSHSHHQSHHGHHRSSQYHESSSHHHYSQSHSRQDQDHHHRNSGGDRNWQDQLLLKKRSSKEHHRDHQSQSSRRRDAGGYHQSHQTSSRNEMQTMEQPQSKRQKTQASSAIHQSTSSYHQYNTQRQQAEHQYADQQPQYSSSSKHGQERHTQERHAQDRHTQDRQTHDTGSRQMQDPRTRNQQHNASAALHQQSTSQQQFHQHTRQSSQAQQMGKQQQHQNYDRRMPKKQ